MSLAESHESDSFYTIGRFLEEEILGNISSGDLLRTPTPWWLYRGDTQISINVPSGNHLMLCSMFLKRIDSKQIICYKMFWLESEENVCVEATVANWIEYIRPLLERSIMIFEEEVESQ